MDTGPFFSGTLGHPGGHTLKGIAIKLGEQGQASICYDTELLRVSCGWTGGFLKFNAFRFGLISAPLVDGAIQFTSPARPGCTPNGRFDDPRPNPPYGPLPRDFAHYEGLHLHGNRVVLAYTVGSTKVMETPWVETSDAATLITREFEIAAGSTELRFLISDGKSPARLIGPTHAATIEEVAGDSTMLVIPARTRPIRIKLSLWTSDPQQQAAIEKLLSASPPCSDVLSLSHPGATRWGEPLVTRGVVSEKPDPYVLDTLTIPLENRYHALMFLSGHDFFANGYAAVCTAHGDVWLVSGIDDKLERITWRRFATGLFQPLGLKVVKRAGQGEVIYVLGRDQITALHDHNQDGEADFYENFNNQGQVTTNAHEFATCLETDSRGNFYYLKGDSGSQTAHDGCLLRVTPDGTRLEVFATGFRNANGMSIGPDDTITVAPQEGTWTPGSAIFQVRQGGFYGAMQSHHRAVPPTTFDPPICWLPRLQDNSSGGQAWVTSDRWGPLKGQLLHFSFGTCRMFLTLRENLDDGVQGGTVQFPLLFDSGVMRGRFRPLDGQLYVTGLKGWVSSAIQDGCLQRVRYTGRPVDLPIKMQTFSNGVALTFTEPLDRDSAEDPDNYGVEEWNYLWSGNYGSPDMKVSTANQVGHDEIEVASATLLPDGQTVFLELPGLVPAMQVAINYTLNANSGRPIAQTYYATLHKLGAEPQPVPLTRKPRPGQLPPEIENSLQPGLVLRTDTGSKSLPIEWGVSRLAAFYIPRPRVLAVAGQGTTVKADWTGYLKIPQKGDYQFRVESRGEAHLKIGEQQIVSDQPVALRRGYQPISLSFVSRHEEIDVRLLWKAPNLPWEALPPGQLFHPHDQPALLRDQQTRSGRDLFRHNGCGNCHVVAPPAAPLADHSEWRMPAPRLEELGERLNPPWVAAWIQRPQRYKVHAAMPRMFHGPDTSGQNQAIADLTAFLTASGKTAPPGSPADTRQPTEAVIEAGLQLYESLGCIACHRFTALEEADSFDRQSLHFVSAKFRVGKIAKFLQNPRRHAPEIRMPDFRLTNSEAESLEAYLRSMSHGTIEALPELAQADIQRGIQRFVTAGCRQCHQVSPRDELSPAKAKIVDDGSVAPGCLFGQKVADGFPLYEFSKADTADLVSFFVSSSTPPRKEFDIERTEREIRRLNCAACHSRDGRNSPLAELLAEEGQGRPPEMFPHLTWAGEKLKADWIDRLLQGRLSYATRPWLKARMPSFPADHLATGIAAEHGIRFDSPSTNRPARPADVQLGRQLTLKGQGLDCRQCHGLGNEKPSGDHSTLISVGINFSHIPERLNPEFYPRLMLNPPRYDPNSRMPVFAVDGKTTAAKGVLNGDAERQFDTIWEYLNHLKP